MLPKLQYAIFLTFIGALNVVHSNIIFSTSIDSSLPALSAADAQSRILIQET